jgi:hypothetical protein
MEKIEPIKLTSKADRNIIIYQADLEAKNNNGIYKTLANQSVGQNITTYYYLKRRPFNNLEKKKVKFTYTIESLYDLLEFYIHEVKVEKYINKFGLKFTYELKKGYFTGNVEEPERTNYGKQHFITEIDTIPELLFNTEEEVIEHIKKIYT